MRVHTKLMLSILPILLLGFVSLSLLSYYSAKDTMRLDAFRYIDTVLEARCDHTLRRRAELLRTTKMDKVASFVSLYQQEALDELRVGSDSDYGCFVVFNEQGEKLSLSGDCDGEPLLSRFRSAAMQAVTAPTHRSRGQTSEPARRVFGARRFQPWNWVLVYSVETSRFEAVLDRTLGVTFGLAALCLAACALVIIVVFQRLLGVPISHLKNAAGRIANRERNVVIAIDSRDELGDLSVSLSSMAAAISDYIDRLERLKHDLELSNEAMGREIEQRRTAQAELKEAHDKLAATFNAIPDLLFEIDAAGRIHDYHAADSHSLAVEPEQFLGKTVNDVMPPGPATTIMNAIAEAAQRGWHRGAVYQLDVPAGRRYFELSIAAKGEPGLPETRFVAIVHDITERAQAEELLRNSEESLQRAADSGNVGLWDWNLRTGEVFFSSVWKRQIGYEDHEIKGRYEEFESRIHPDDRKATISALQAAQEPPWPKYQAEFRLQHKDGSYRWIVATGALQFDAQAHPVRMMGSHVDVTESKLAEEKNVRLENQLSQARKMESVGRLAGGVAHDFNNMLGVILGHSELALMRGGLSPELLESLVEIRKAGERSKDLAKQLLAFARKQTIVPKVLDLNAALTGMLSMLKRIIGENIDLAWFPGDALWAVKVDPSQVDQILANLCVNARDAISNVGKITIRTTNFTADDVAGTASLGLAPGEYVQLTVADNGRGMTAEIQALIFEPFFTTKRFGEGTGLGLATVYGIVKQNDGFIHVSSEPGQGTAFNIFFPRYRGAAEEHRTPSATKPKLLAGQKILLVEDDSSLLALTKTTLESLGHTVLPASSAALALQLADEHPGSIDLLVTDVVMPDMNGRDLAERLRSIHPHLRCLFMSGYSADVIANHGVLNEGVHFLQKPFNIDDLVAKLAEVVHGGLARAQ